MHDVVVLIIAFRKDHHAAALVQPLHRAAEGRDEAGVVINPHGMGAVENQHAQRGNQIAGDFKQPADRLRLSGPEVAVGIGRHLLQVHHFACAPDIVLSGDIEFPGDGAEHLAVVADDDAGLVRQVFRPLEAVFRGKLPHEPADDPIEAGCFFVIQITQDAHAFCLRMIRINRIMRKSEKQDLVH